jgi:hypothetical protein
VGVIGHRVLRIGLWYSRSADALTAVRSAGAVRSLEGRTAPEARIRAGAREPKEIRRNRLEFFDFGSGEQGRTGCGKAIAATDTGRPPMAVALTKAPGMCVL